MGINRTGGGTWRSKARSRTPRIQEPRLTRRQRQQALDQLEHDQALAAAEATQIGTTD